MSGSRGAVRVSLTIKRLPRAPLSPWTVTFTPYGWLTALNGDVTVKGRSVDINVVDAELGIEDIVVEGERPRRAASRCPRTLKAS